MTANSSRKTQDGIVIGNVTDKEHMGGIGGRLIAGFDRTLAAFLVAARPRSIHEVGCGEGRLIRKLLLSQNVPLRATDFSRELIEHLLASPLSDRVQFTAKSIYDLVPPMDTADTVVCCEVLEHLEEPEEAVRALRGLSARQYILSVPNEPLWRMLNCIRGKYWKDWGNTPGHLNHWSKGAFIQLLSEQGLVVEAVAQPLPWTMVRARRA